MKPISLPATRVSLLGETFPLKVLLEKCYVRICSIPLKFSYKLVTVEQV